MADDFFKKAKDAARAGGIDGVKARARSFFRNKVKELGKKETPGKLLKSRPDRLVSKGNLGIGKLYFFMYDPKLKKELPYYDRFPLIFVIGRKGTKSGAGFMGLNLHYLPPKRRAVLLGNLLDTANNSRFDETTKLKISYDILKSAAKFKAFKPTIKQYLNAHVKSRFLLVPADDWLPAVFLPVAEFEKASEKQVWSASRKIIQG